MLHTRRRARGRVARFPPRSLAWRHPALPGRPRAGRTGAPPPRAQAGARQPASACCRCPLACAHTRAGWSVCVAPPAEFWAMLLPYHCLPVPDRTHDGSIMPLIQPQGGAERKRDTVPRRNAHPPEARAGRSGTRLKGAQRSLCDTGRQDRCSWPGGRTGRRRAQGSLWQPGWRAVKQLPCIEQWGVSIERGMYTLRRHLRGGNWGVVQGISFHRAEISLILGLLLARWPRCRHSPRVAAGAGPFPLPHSGPAAVS